MKPEGLVLRLPNSELAIVDVKKLRDYCLNPEHLQGQHKARVFAAALNLTISAAGILSDLLLEAAQSENAEPAKQDNYGQRYIIDFEVVRQGKTARVRSAWIIRRDENFPRLITCYVL